MAWYLIGEVTGDSLLEASLSYIEADWSLVGEIITNSSFNANLSQIEAQWSLDGEIVSSSALTEVHCLEGNIDSASFSEAFLLYIEVEWDLSGYMLGETVSNANLTQIDMSWELEGEMTGSTTLSANLANLYTAIFKDWDGTVLATSFVVEGESATPPADPFREGHTFTGWSKSYSNITNDIEIIAIYEILVFSIAYVAGIGGALSGDLVQFINYGGTGTPVIATSFAGYQFSEWSDGVSTATRIDTNVTYTKTVTAIFSSLTGGLYNADMLLYRNPLLG